MTSSCAFSAAGSMVLGSTAMVAAARGRMGAGVGRRFSLLATLQPETLVFLKHFFSALRSCSKH